MRVWLVLMMLAGCSGLPPPLGQPVNGSSEDKTVKFDDALSPDVQLHQPYAVGAQVPVFVYVSGSSDGRNRPARVLSSNSVVAAVEQASGFMDAQGSGILFTLNALSEGDAVLDVLSNQGEIIGTREIAVRAPDTARLFDPAAQRFHGADAGPLEEPLLVRKGESVVLGLQWFRGDGQVWGFGNVIQSLESSCGTVEQRLRPDAGTAHLVLQCERPGAIQFHFLANPAREIAVDVTDRLDALVMDVVEAQDGGPNRALVRGVAADGRTVVAPDVWISGPVQVAADRVMTWAPGPYPAAVEMHHQDAVRVEVIRTHRESPGAASSCQSAGASAVGLLALLLWGWRRRGNAS